MVNPKTGKVLGADEETDDPLRDVKKGPALLLLGLAEIPEQLRLLLGGEPDAGVGD